MGLESKVVEDIPKDNEPQIDREKVHLKFSCLFRIYYKFFFFLRLVHFYYEYFAITVVDITVVATIIDQMFLQMSYKFILG